MATRFPGVTLLLVQLFFALALSIDAEAGFVEKLSCNFDSFSQAREGPQVPGCFGGRGLGKWTWYRSFRFFPYQFDIVPNLPDEQAATNFAISRCTRKPSQILDCPNAPTAIVRSPAYNPTHCTTFGLSFWYRLSRTSVVARNHGKNFYLELRLHYSGDPWPQRSLWQSDDDKEPGEWIHITTEFDVEKNRQFTLNFFAHHTDFCQENVEEIALDAIQTAILKTEECSPPARTDLPPVTADDIKKFCSSFIVPIHDDGDNGAEEPVYQDSAEEVREPDVPIEDTQTVVQDVNADQCPYPKCYEWRTKSNLHHLSCYFGNRVQVSTGPDVDACAGWHRTTSWFDYQFDIVSYEEEKVPAPLSGGAMFALSKCTKKQNALSTETDAAAVLQSPVYPGKKCQHYQISFWYILSDEPNFSGSPDSYFLQLRLQYASDKGIPQNVLWGTEQDYDFFVDAGIWKKQTVEFALEKDGGFLLNFMANHNDGCRNDVRPTGVDSIETKTAVRTIC